VQGHPLPTCLLADFLMDPYRRYTTQEVRSILKRAARHQADADRAADGLTAGLTLTDIQTAAEDAGIDPSHVRRAALDITIDREDGVVSRRRLNAEVSDAAWTAIVAELRRVYGAAGSTGRVGETQEWTCEITDGPSVHATLDTANGTSVVTVRQQRGKKQAMYVSGGTIFVIGCLLGALYLAGDFASGVGYLVAGILASAALLFAVASPLDAWIRRRTQDTLDARLDRLGLIAMRHAAAAEPTPEASETIAARAPGTAERTQANENSNGQERTRSPHRPRSRSR
jgi:hypothetical protein